VTSRWGFVTIPIVAAFELGRQNTDRTTYGLRYLVLLMVSDSLSGGESMAEFMAGGGVCGCSSLRSSKPGSRDRDQSQGLYITFKG